MPNWCNNVLEVYGTKEELQKFKEDVKGSEDDYLDFEKIIPTKEHQEEFRKVWENNKELQKRFSDFETAWFNEGKGYEWCVNNWGTKWRVRCEKPQESDNSLRYYFSSAWASPVGIVLKLIETYKNLDFHLDYEESGMGFGGEIESSKGVITTQEEYDVESFICPECESWLTQRADDSDKCECSDCGVVFKKTDSKDNDYRY